ncbi:MAG: DnaJ domain-containing protein, partial [Deltaproteobacteria bacterium]|nr:DnaJ domain-containing protein [Deltaproteobacteria bacterium]
MPLGGLTCPTLLEHYRQAPNGGQSPEPPDERYDGGRGTAMADEYYEILGVAKDADEAAIKKAFRAIARECHPDVAGDDPTKGLRFKRAREAYETLVEPTLRARYDRPRKKVVREGGQHGSFFDAMWKRTAADPAAGPDLVPGGRLKVKPLSQGAHDGGGQPKESRSQGRADGRNSVDLDDLFAGGFGTRERAASRPKGARRNVDIGEDPLARGSWQPRESPPGGPGPATGRGSDDPDAPRRGEDLAMEVDVPLSVAQRGGTVTTSYLRLGRNPRWVPHGTQPEVAEIEDVLDLRIIRGTRDGEVLQERGKGNAGTSYGPFGDLYVTVRV